MPPRGAKAHCGSIDYRTPYDEKGPHEANPSKNHAKRTTMRLRMRERNRAESAPGTTPMRREAERLPRAPCARPPRAHRAESVQGPIASGLGATPPRPTRCGGRPYARLMRAPAAVSSTTSPSPVRRSRMASARAQSFAARASARAESNASAAAATSSP